MKKYLSFILILVVFFVSFCSVSVNAQTDTYDTPITVDLLNEGIYPIEVKSSSSMFRIVQCDLIVSENEMQAVMTLSGKGYEKLFMGTGEEALSFSDEDYIFFVENQDGKYTYTVPVSALDEEIHCAAWSIKKQKWYDRKLVFKSGSLPEDAFKKDYNYIPTIIVVLLCFISVTFIFIKGRNNKMKGSEPNFENEF